MTETIKGFKDKTGKEAEKASFIREVIKQTFERYNFQEVETPIIEYEKFVKESSDEGDEVISDIFKLKDKGNRDLALRYEFTFQLKRILQNQKLPFKRFQIGPVFRDEPVKLNRFRQFTQCDIDTVGGNIKDEAEILAATKDILNALKIKSTIYVNNRKLLNEILEEQGIKNKLEVIRELDKLDKLPVLEVKEKLKKLNAEKILTVLKKPKEYFKKYKSFSEIEELIKYCKYYGFDIVFSPFLARGLSYYVGNVYEVKSDIKANGNISINSSENRQIKETICGGGTYKIKDIVSSGISLSLERLMIVTKVLINVDKILIVSLNQDRKAIALAKQLRKKGKNVSIYYGKPSKALAYANSYGIKKVILIGAKEIKVKKFKIKDMDTGKESALKL
ncbi:histidine--tRNA ligase [Candidatus Pacearchaeota archaeon]|nr:histidine--tRNA ligase [Candidatus Pacearchaeota archaeon]